MNIDDVLEFVQTSRDTCMQKTLHPYPCFWMSSYALSSSGDSRFQEHACVFGSLGWMPCASVQ